MINNQKVVFCTYFDKGFLLKGLALYESLVRYNPKIRLWILALDDYTENILKRMKLKGVTVVSLEEFEDKKLLSAKKNRSKVEYYWTCTPSWILYVLGKNHSAELVVYLDSDIFFYDDALKAVEEIKSKSILIVSHRFPKGREGMAQGSGEFNVAFNIFRNDKVGTACLKRWREQCLNWCYWKHEKGKLGDQMYLDEWPNLYGKDLVISENIGVDVAPWNVSQYKISLKNEVIWVNDKRLVCYHFHQFQILGPNRYSRVLGYTLSKDVVKYIYEPYGRELDKQYQKIKSFDQDFKIEVAERNKKVLLRGNLSRYIGSIYWKIRYLFKR